MKTSEQQTSRDLRSLETLVAILDNGLRVPGTNIRIGIDPLIGLLPGIGDALGAALGSLLILKAAGAGAPKRHLARMLGNLLIDYLVGLVPLLGDIFDLTFRANERNLAVIRSIDPSEWGPRRDADAVGKLVAYTILGAFVVVVSFVGWVVVSLLRALVG